MYVSCWFSRHYHRRGVTDEMRKDINSCLMFLEKFNVVTSCRLINWSNDFDPILRNIQKVQALLI